MAEITKRRRLSLDGTFEETSPSKTQDEQPTASTEEMKKAEIDPKKKDLRRQLFVRSLAPGVTSEQLTEHFSQSYPLKHATVVVDPVTKTSRGYGFVTFVDVEDAERAVEEFNNTEFEGKKIRVEVAQPRKREVEEKEGKSVSTSVKDKKQGGQDQDAKPPRLIVRNLPWSIKEPEDLALLFRSYGKVKHTVLPKKDGKLGGFGFVVLRGKKNAEKALAGVNGKEIDGRTLAVDWAVEKSVWDDVTKRAEDEEASKEEELVQDDDKSDGGVDVEAELAGEAEELDDDETSSDGEDDEDESELEDEDEEDEEDEEEEHDKDDTRNQSTVFIRNLPFTATDETLHEHFTQFGAVRYARVVMDYETERSRGTGFVCFYEQEDAISCIRQAPKKTAPVVDKAGKQDKRLSHSILENTAIDSTGRYTMDGRVLQISLAVSKTEATRLEEEGTTARNARDKDKRRLYLLSEGTIPSNSPLYKKLSPTEITMREASAKQRQTLIKNNPTLHLSLTRLSIRNIPRNITTKDLKALAREAVVGFAKDVKGGLRQPLSKEELSRRTDEMVEEDKRRKEKGKGIVKQAKIVFETREGSKVAEGAGGRSRGYGFIEYFTHRNALMGLRWLNGHAVKAPASTTPGEKAERPKRMIVEFAIENAQVINRRREFESKAREQGRTGGFGNGTDGKERRMGPGKSDAAFARKRKREEKDGKSHGRPDKRATNGNAAKSAGKGKPKAKTSGPVDEDEANRVAKRNRIIAQKRMKRRARN